MKNDSQKKLKHAKASCIVAAIFYILVAFIAMSTLKADDMLFETGNLFGIYENFIFNRMAKKNEASTVEYADLTEESTEAVTEEPEEAVTEEPSEEAVEEPSEEVVPEEPADGEKYYSCTAITSKASRLNMRRQPTIKEKIVGTIPPGETGYVLETGDEWTKVCYKGHEGYCSNEYLNLQEITKEEYEEGLKENEPG